MTYYRTKNGLFSSVYVIQNRDFRAHPVFSLNQSSGSTFGWPSSFASYSKVCHICPLEFVIVFRLKNLRPGGPLWSFEAIHRRGYRREFSKR